MSLSDFVTPDPKAPAPVNTPVVMLGTSISSANGSRTPCPASDYQSQILLNEVSLRLERFSLERVRLETEEIEEQ